jgi:hypothetical protein
LRGFFARRGIGGMRPTRLFFRLSGEAFGDRCSSPDRFGLNVFDPAREDVDFRMLLEDGLGTTAAPISFAASKAESVFGFCCKLAF